MELELIKYLPWIPALAAALCGLCCADRAFHKLAGVLCVLATLATLVLTVGTYAGFDGESVEIVTAFAWMGVGSFTADFGYWIDSLTFLMLFVVCGIGTLIALYATGYMAGERGYARFFSFVALFIFAMTSLVMADNLVLLYLGWEGVGLCSYLLIGYYYDRPSAVAAGKKAFIVNRIGDLGFALGLFLTYLTFGSIEYEAILPAAQALLGGEVELSETAAAALASAQAAPQSYLTWIPFLLMLGAFGKSAQIPLYVWLPDAMEGPTPVSALIHAATMVTAGVYMIARLVPLFELSPAALPTVATIGALTALFAATIALCQYDIKRVWAYSTVSQLGYMFLGVGALSTVGGIFHLFTHAFFKALLFLTAGSVMHALAGQLDLRKMSGLREKMPVTCWLMFVGCLALAGFPLTAGFFSKDLILADALAMGTGEHGRPLFLILALLGLVTAFLTAYYTFRLWFRVFLGPVHFEMGDEHHGDEVAHGHDEQGHGHHEPHEMPFWPMNAPLIVLAAGAIFAGLAFKPWVAASVASSSAAAAGAHGDAHPELLGMDLHNLMMVVSGIIAIAGIAVAWFFHLHDRAAADRAAEGLAPVVRLLENKYWVDELYDRVIVRPLWAIGHLLYYADTLIVHSIVILVGWVPRVVGLSVRPTQHGRLQGYGIGMVAGLGVIMLILTRYVINGD